MDAEIFTTIIPTMVLSGLSVLIWMLIALYIPYKNFHDNPEFYFLVLFFAIFSVGVFSDIIFLSKNPLPSSKLLMMTSHDWILTLVITIIFLFCAFLIIKIYNKQKIPENIRWITGPTLFALIAALVMTLTGSNLPTHENMYLVRGRVYIVEKDKQTGGTNFILRDNDKNLHLLRTDVVIDTQSIEYNLGSEPYLSLVCASDQAPVRKIEDIAHTEKEIPSTQVCKSDTLVTEKDLDKIIEPVKKGRHRWSLEYF